jgi:hypothetical protein
VDASRLAVELMLLPSTSLPIDDIVEIGRFAEQNDDPKCFADQEFVWISGFR